MPLDDDLCYRALITRDGRFDGRFYVGVSTTRVYCRPVCRVRTPLRRNCSFFATAAAAEGGGFRPCLKCRPELAPEAARFTGHGRLAQAAARLIQEYIADGLPLGQIAARVGITERHLRRLFVAEYGVTPVAWAQTQRLLLAKQLLTDTALPVAEVAHAAGFGSVRRLNTLIRERYRLSPSTFRQAVQADAPAHGLHFHLAARPPFAWRALCGFLARRAIPGVESVQGEVYRRTLTVLRDGVPHRGWFEARYLPDPRATGAVLRITAAESLAPVAAPMLAACRRLFDLSGDPEAVLKQLGELAAGAPGLRVPGSIDVFEVAVRGIVGQQISVAAATTLAGRLAAAFGQPLDTPWADLRHTFPSAAVLACTSPAALGALGIIRRRSECIVALARELVEGRLCLVPGADPEAAIAQLRCIPGIGEWTAQYIAMRALSWPDAFLATDLGVQRAMRVSRPREALARAEPYRPWRAYAVMHLWNSLE
jgi:AraC family transcriptional regulator of adaptative response / DNA-3-methyladenine glycosylase II